MLRTANNSRSLRLSLGLVGTDYSRSGDLISVSYSQGFGANRSSNHRLGMEGAIEFRNIFDSPVETVKTVDLDGYEFNFDLYAPNTDPQLDRLRFTNITYYNAMLLYFDKNNPDSFKQVSENIAKIRRLAPNTPIYLMGFNPSSDEDSNTSAIEISVAQAVELAKTHNVQWVGFHNFEDSNIQRVVTHVMYDAFRANYPEVHRENSVTCRKAIEIYNNV